MYLLIVLNFVIAIMYLCVLMSLLYMCALQVVDLHIASYKLLLVICLDNLLLHNVTQYYYTFSDIFCFVYIMVQLFNSIMYYLLSCFFPQ